MAEVRNLINGTGGCWAVEALADATRSREAAEADGAETWSHLLVEAVSRVMVETDENRLLTELAGLTRLVREWREVLEGRLSGEIHGPRCLCFKCNPDAANTHNTKLALN